MTRSTISYRSITKRGKQLSTLMAALIFITSLFLSGLFGTAGSAQASLPSTSALASQPAAAASPDDDFRFPAYFIEWGVYGRNYVPADIPVDALTHINYAFIDPRDTDGDGMFECGIIDPWAAEQMPLQRLVPGTDIGAGEHLGTFNQLRVLRRNHPGLKVLMSLGGWTLSSNFPTIASTPAQRTHFAESCVQFMQDKHFDGIDVDWEFPTLADRDNFTALLQTFRDELDDLSLTTGSYYPLTIAGPPAANQIDAIDLAAISTLLDWVNVMSYDFGGGWDTNTGANSPLCASPSDPHGPTWNVAGTIQHYAAGGLPLNKMHLGLPYYGRAFQHLQDAGPDPNYPGRFATVTAGDFITGTWDVAPELTGVFDYWDIKDKYAGAFQPSITPIPGVDGYTRYWDNEQHGPFVFRPDAVGQNGHGIWMGFDDPQSLTNKVNFARTIGLAGVFVWELSQEGHPGTTEHPLTNAISAAITGPLVNFTCGAASTPTVAPSATASASATATVTRTPVPPTQTPGGPTATNTSTSVPPTATATNTSVPPTQTPGGPTATNTSTSVPPTATATTVLPSCLIEFTDVPEGSTFYTFIRCLACNQILGGYPDGTFRPGNNVTRGQLSKIVSNAAGFNDTVTGQLFEDIVPGSNFYEFIGRLASRGYINGYACGGPGEPCNASGLGNLPYFRPGNNATRGQISKIVSNAAAYSDPVTGQIFADVPSGSPFYDWIQRLTSRQIMGGYPCGGANEPCGTDNLPYFRPNSNATRGQIAKIVSNTFFPDCETR